MFDTCFGCIYNKPGPGGCLEPELEQDTKMTPAVRRIHQKECLITIFWLFLTSTFHNFQIASPAFGVYVPCFCFFCWEAFQQPKKNKMNLRLAKEFCPPFKGRVDRILKFVWACCKKIFMIWEYHSKKKFALTGLVLEIRKIKLFGVMAGLEAPSTGGSGHLIDGRSLCN